MSLWRYQSIPPKDPPLKIDARGLYGARAFLAFWGFGRHFWGVTKRGRRAGTRTRASRPPPYREAPGR